jgi:hypothetical protein
VPEEESHRLAASRQKSPAIHAIICQAMRWISLLGLRIASPTAAKPERMNAQVAGSGTEAMLIVPE